MNNQASMCNNGCCLWMGKNGKAMGLLIIRLFVGFVFAMAGYRMLFGGGMPMIQGAVSALHLPAAALLAYVVAFLEFFGGLFLVAGIMVRPIAGLLAVTMAVAFFGTHQSSLVEGMPSFILLGVCAGLFCTGGGCWSVWKHCCLNGRSCACHGDEKSMGGCGQGACACKKK